ncbi:hypothetical protein Cs7R123_68740 [Catellatospora sp. TT07R-123]|uniref:hypothetical protein n=1 Tax=Catellatospora sp. TT07R-123 TaxID=2733863 RepID=UPI001B13E31F|nr:hypothetical protein [Catellatospora sp. TT07R-123]GHJ49532.1 hypothetical protein Cs7R123_68740 [Catellatospora sp. TT07R-123]
MSFDQLMQHATDIGNKAFEEGLGELMGTQSPTLVAQEQPKLINRCYGEVPQLFQPFSQIPDPASYTPAIESLKRALGRLCTGQDTRDPISTNGSNYYANPVLDKLSASGDYIESWTGKAAMEFKANFIDPFPSVARNQFLLISALKAGLEAEQAMWEAARKDIDQIAENTLKALDCMDDCSPKEWAVTFTAAAAITGILLTIPTLGTSAVAAISISTVGAAAWVAAALPPSPPTLNITGDHTNAVLDSMHAAVDKASQVISETEQRIAKAMDSILDAIHSHRDYFVAPRPSLAGATKQNITRPEYMGYSD